MQFPQTPLFADHARRWRENRYVYPVVSRRAGGVSIGINLNPGGECNFDCVYCCVDRRPEKLGDPHVDLPELEAELRHTLQLVLSGEIFRHPPFDQTPPALRRLNDVAFSGDGEPTTYLRFPDACKVATRAVEDLDPSGGTKVVVISNATMLHRPSVTSAIDHLYAHRGELWGKLDAGTANYYHRIDRSSVPFQRVLDNLLVTSQRHPIVVQSMFASLHGDLPSAEEVAAYVGRLRAIVGAGGKVRLVQVYTVARATAEAYCGPLATGVLEGIAGEVRKTGLRADVFGAGE